MLQSSHVNCKKIFPNFSVFSNCTFLDSNTKLICETLVGVYGTFYLFWFGKDTHTSRTVSCKSRKTYSPIETFSGKCLQRFLLTYTKRKNTSLSTHCSRYFINHVFPTTFLKILKSRKESMYSIQWILCDLLYCGKWSWIKQVLFPFLRWKQIYLLPWQTFPIAKFVVSIGHMQNVRKSRIFNIHSGLALFKTFNTISIRSECVFQLQHGRQCC